MAPLVRGEGAGLSLESHTSLFESAAYNEARGDDFHPRLFSPSPVLYLAQGIFIESAPRTERQEAKERQKKRRKRQGESPETQPATYRFHVGS